MLETTDRVGESSLMNEFELGVLLGLRRWTLVKLASFCKVSCKTERTLLCLWWDKGMSKLLKAGEGKGVWLRSLTSKVSSSKVQPLSRSSTDLSKLEEPKILASGVEQRYWIPCCLFWEAGLHRDFKYKNTRYPNLEHRKANVKVRHQALEIRSANYPVKS